MEIRTEMKVVAHLEEMQCNICGMGKMIYNGISLMSYPAKYQHVCNNCKWQENYLKCYPCTNIDAVPFETGMVVYD